MVTREHLLKLGNIQEPLFSRRHEAHFCWGISRLTTPNLWNFQRVLHTLAATQEVPRHTRSSSRSAIMVVSSAYLSWLIFLPAILIPAYVSSIPAFFMMYSAYIPCQSWCFPQTNFHLFRDIHRNMKTITFRYWVYSFHIRLLRFIQHSVWTKISSYKFITA